MSDRTFDPNDVVMSVFVIYRVQSTVNFLVREHFILTDNRTQPGPLRGGGQTLTEARRAVPASADARIVRSTSDAPEIIETWM